MPPQTTAAPTPFPGEDVLLDTLRRSKITDDQRQQIWDVYHTKGNQDDFIGAINKTQFPDDIKQTLYDMRFKGFKNLPTNQQAPAPSATQPISQPSTHISPLAPGTYQGVKGGGLHTVDQTVPNALIQGIEGIFGIKPRPDDWQHPYLDAFAQAMKSGARLVEQTAKDPFTPAHAIVGGVSQAISDIQSGIAKRDPRQVAGGVGQIIGL